MHIEMQVTYLYELYIRDEVHYKAIENSPVQTCRFYIL